MYGFFMIKGNHTNSNAAGIFLTNSKKIVRRNFFGFDFNWKNTKAGKSDRVKIKNDFETALKFFDPDFIENSGGFGKYKALLKR